MTNKFLQFIFCFIFAMVFFSCGEKKPMEGQFSKVAVSWKHIENKIQDEHYLCKAALSFKNNSNDTLKYGDWALYFNQNTLRMAEAKSANIGLVEHVNGDLYRFVPGKDFKLSPGDSLKFSYEYNGILIKDSDAPKGVYFVNNHGKDNEEVVMPEAVFIAPFEDLNAIFPDANALSAFPNAANIYATNLSIGVLPKKDAGKIIPSPANITALQGKTILNANTVVHYQKGLENEANILAESLKKLFGLQLKIQEGNSTSTNAIQLNLSPLAITDKGDEAYQLSAKANQAIVISANKPAGVFYGIQSLLSLLWADKSGNEVGLECTEILDAPRFAYRGFLLDVARNFQQKKDVLRLIDLLASYKINVLNIRITEDEAWRIEINGLPELTKVGSKRGHSRDSKNWLPPSFGSGPYPDGANNYGNGFYTREDFKDILKYAQQRHIKVIPEVCFPSHARAAIKAMEARYDYYMAKNDVKKANEFRLIDPDDKSEYISAQMYKDNIVNVALPSTYHFYETVVKDFKAMYEEAGLKMTVFNTGGDEVPNGAWAKSPLCIALMKSMPDIKDARQLQGYFLEKAMSIFEKHQLQVSGWEEIVLNKDKDNNVTVNTKFVGKNVLPLVWDNTGDNIDLGYRIANAGYPVVLCNVTNLYFDLAYNHDPKEPGLYWGGFQDAIDPYVMAPYDVYKTANFDMFGRLGESNTAFPLKQKLINKKMIAGIQAQLWSETIKGPGMMEYYIVPKVFAFAEKAWAQAPEWENENNIKKRNQAILSGWNGLANRIGQNEFSKIDAWFGDYNYRVAPPGAVIENGLLKANVAFPGLTIRYTTDGTEPNENSQVYTAPVKVSGMVRVKAFNQKGKTSRSLNVL